MTELDPNAKTLLELAREGDHGTLADRQRVRARLSKALGAAAFGSAIATTTKAGAAGGIAAAGAPGVAKLVAWAVAGLVVGLGGIATVQSLSDSGSPARRASVERPERASNRGPTQNLPRENPQLPAPSDEPPSPPTRTARPEARGSSSAESEAESAVAQDTTLAEETRLLEGAHAALSRGDAAAAVVLLDRHEQRFPVGLLREERLAAQSIAQCRLGNRAAALRAAETLRAASPRSPLWPRVAAACDLPNP